ncbi:MAG: hypothetical protein KIS92_18540 [Planctomycetota bacterium]|nr:hypothetical protein [Planctomycetota bacterium]
MANDLSDDARTRFRERALRLCVWLAAGGLFTWAVVADNSVFRRKSETTGAAVR